MTVRQVTLGQSAYWLAVPPNLPPDAPALVHLHHSGNGRSLARDPDNQAHLADRGFIGVFPMGGGEPGDDWNVGRNKDDIPRDDRAIIAEVAIDVRDQVDAGALWLSGYSKGGAMVYDYACLGEGGLYAGFLPMSGAFEDWVFDDCSHEPAPIRHLQGDQDDRWPRTTADDPESSHQGILDSLQALRATDADCLTTPPSADGTCEVWDSCPEDVRLCTFSGGHTEPADWVLGHADWVEDR